MRLRLQLRNGVIVDLLTDNVLDDLFGNVANEVEFARCDE
jgi:hypothetical protein